MRQTLNKPFHRGFDMIWKTWFHSSMINFSNQVNTELFLDLSVCGILGIWVLVVFLCGTGCWESCSVSTSKNEALAKIQTRRLCKLFCILSPSCFSLLSLSFTPLAHAHVIRVISAWVQRLHIFNREPELQPLGVESVMSVRVVHITPLSFFLWSYGNHCLTLLKLLRERLFLLILAAPVDKSGISTTTQLQNKTLAVEDPAGYFSQNDFQLCLWQPEQVF